MSFVTRIADRTVSSIAAAVAILALFLPLAATAQTGLRAAQSRKQAAPPCHTEPQGAFASGQAALTSGDLGSAERHFREVLACDPRSGAAYANLGVVYMRRREWEHALQALTKAQKLAPNLIGVRLNIGLVHFRQGDYANAIPAFEAVVHSDAASDQARYLLGLSYFFEGRYADAARTLASLWPRTQNDFNYLYVLGLSADKAGDKALGERAFTRLAEVGEDSAEFHLLMGKAYLNRLEPQNAVPELEKASAKDPRLPFVHFNLGLAYLRTHDYDRAKSEFQKDIAIEPDVAYNYDQLGTLYLALGNNAEAERNFREALTRDSRLATSYFGLAKIYEQQGKPAEALDAANAAERLDPTSSSLHYVRARLLQKLGKKEEAKIEFAESERLLAAGNSDKLSPSQTPNPELASPVGGGSPSGGPSNPQ
jgi:tetratricopeptide (TPR) repeat protein